MSESERGAFQRVRIYTIERGLGMSQSFDRARFCVSPHLRQVTKGLQHGWYISVPLHEEILPHPQYSTVAGY